MVLKSISRQGFILLILSIIFLTVGCSNSDSDTVTSSTTNTGAGSTENNSGVVSTIAGTGSAGSANGVGTEASFNGPYGVAIDSADNIIVADLFNHLIRKIDSDGVVSTIAGTTSAGSADGTGTAARFNRPTDVAIDSAGNIIVTDINNYLIRKIQ